MVFYDSYRGGDQTQTLLGALELKNLVSLAFLLSFNIDLVVQQRHSGIKIFPFSKFSQGGFPWFPILLIRLLWRELVSAYS